MESKTNGVHWTEWIEGPRAFWVPEYFIMKVIKKYYYLLLGKLVLSLKGKYYGGSPLSIADRTGPNEDNHG